ncbi:uncharacterized protein K452DRAFT_293806 [Aplosporella prunicola CBS 121167]|uniref:DUF1917 domain-containing protein n=1 Tax=Aplosporella prunicola CBS 121167 TaxID=1176127 RepID=A0A6A6BTB9_9PEZI|nr:uncharacterized protein K452DRAFT_293806 [Aplosporella prunicola CBS 121167]KAF2147369.1 hypothetical protein K452DRAFT_293806 [Aplosporella prunicola CBS 121167]
MTEELVSGDGCISDESSFYGDETTKAAWEARTKAFDPASYWEHHETYPATMAHRTRAEAQRLAADDANAMGMITSNSARGSAEASRNAEKATVKLNLTHEGDPRWYQPTETVSEFLKRCPPLKTICEDTGIDWFWVGNPHASSYNQQPADVDTFIERGYGLLEAYQSKRAELESANPSSAKGTITRKLGPEREKLKQRIADLARAKHVVCGKWMLFPREEDLLSVWAQVCEAVLANRLGHTAKTGTTWAGKAETHRLICVYTKDWSDVDVRRVLLSLVNLGLVAKDDPRGIWYKTDAYTYLDLSSGNAYNLPASLYSSKEMLKGGAVATKRKGEASQKQTSAKKPKEAESKKQTKGKQRSLMEMFG